ncbi:MAG: hypothetical protein IPH23_14910 [Gammaproteobacteria bacterium]|nr:hypothetical protein [Gammaproteobacteria bacterium]
MIEDRGDHRFDRPGRLTLWVAGLLLFAGALAAVHAGIPLTGRRGYRLPPAADRPRRRHADGVFWRLRHAGGGGAIALAATPELPLWQTPREWIDLLRLTPPGATLAFAVYGLVAVCCRCGSTKPRQQPPRWCCWWRHALFGGLFLLASA